MSGLGRRIPPNFDHVEKYPIRGVLQADPSTITVNRTFRLPWWHWDANQGKEGACVGFGTSMTAAIVRTKENKEINGPKPWTMRYDPWWLWNQAKLKDGFPDTNPGDDNGTTVDAACQVARDLGLVKYDKRFKDQGTPDPKQGFTTYRWATTVDEMRTAIAGGGPITIGVNWYHNFDTPEQVGKDWYIGRGDLGPIRGGHCVCLYGASDRREAFRLCNSWGRDYPLTWLTYETMQRLLNEEGEAAIITSR